MAALAAEAPTDDEDAYEDDFEDEDVAERLRALAGTCCDTEELRVDAAMAANGLATGNRISRIDHCIFPDTIDEATKLALVDEASQNKILDRAMGSVAGLVIADAVGHPFEFMDAVDDAPGFDRATMKYTNQLNRFDLDRGQWTDDGSMALCAADSLIVHRGFVPEDLRMRFWTWWNRGYNNAFRRDRTRIDRSSVGLGGNISKSLASMKAGAVPSKFYEGDDLCGNQMLRRISYHGPS